MQNVQRWFLLPTGFTYSVWWWHEATRQQSAEPRPLLGPVEWTDPETLMHFSPGTAHFLSHPQQTLLHSRICQSETLSCWISHSSGFYWLSLKGRWMIWNEIRVAARLAWLTVVSHKQTNNKIYSERPPARALNHSDSICDKTVTAVREDLINFLSWTPAMSGPPSLMMCDSCQVLFFILSWAHWWIIAGQKKSNTLWRKWHTDSVEKSLHWLQIDNFKLPLTCFCTDVFYKSTYYILT